MTSYSNHQHKGLEKCDLKPKVQYIQIDDSDEYLITDKCFYPKIPDDFNQLVDDFTKNPDNFFHHPDDSSYLLEDGKILFKNSKDEITTFNYIPICSVSGNIREINGKKISSLLWTCNDKSLGVSKSLELKQKIEFLKELREHDFKLKQYGLAFREHEFEDPLDTAIYQASVYTAWFCRKMDGFKIFCNFASGGNKVELQDFEKKKNGLSHIIRPFMFVILYK